MASFRHLLLACAVPVAIAGCAAEDDATTGDDEVVSGSSRTIATDEILQDGDIEGGAGITEAEVQKFLAAKGSALAKYTEDERSAAGWIVQESRAEKISPLYMLVRLETESGIVSSGSLNNIKSATGCGCPDTAKCDPKYANFGPQVRCAAKLMRGYFTSLETKKSTVSGWRIGGSKNTLDPCAVTPKNKATAALYTYNPWVGAYGVGCGSSKWGGASLIGRLFKAYKPSFPGVDDDAKAPAKTEETEKPETPAAETPEAAACPKDGLFCGGNGVAGEPDELWRCAGGKAAKAETCARGCIATPPGGDDICRP